MKEVNKTVEGLKLELEGIKKRQIEEFLEWKKSMFENRIYRLKHHQQNTKHGRDNLRYQKHNRRNGYIGQEDFCTFKVPDTKQPGNLKYCEKTKFKDNSRRKSRLPVQGPRWHILKNHRR